MYNMASAHALDIVMNIVAHLLRLVCLDAQALDDTRPALQALN